MVVTNLKLNLYLYCVCVDETVKVVLVFHWVLQVLQVLTGFCTGQTDFGCTTILSSIRFRTHRPTEVEVLQESVLP